MRAVPFALLAAGALVPLACHDHSHPHDHDHGAAAEDEGPTLAITRWSERYELFVELPAPTPGQPIPYHAHLTRLDDFQAVTEGTFVVQFFNGAQLVLEATQEGVKRPGIFVFESAAPPAGAYTLKMRYQLGDQADTFDCGTVEVASPAKAEEGELPGGSITFLKEAQWKIPFGTAWVETRPLAEELELAGVVEPAATDQLTLVAPTSGRFFQNPKLALAEGLQVKKGELIGTIVPSVSGEDFSRLELAVEETRLHQAQLERELLRVTPLVAQGLLPLRRKVELENELASLEARLKSAGGRLSGVLSPSAQGGSVPVRSTLAGLISMVLVPNGAPVEAGSPLLRIGGTDHLWIRTRFVAKPAGALLGGVPIAARLPSGERIALEGRAHFLSTLPVVDARSRIATWIVDVTPGEGVSGLLPGSSVVLAVRVGEPERRLSVHRTAVVDINTRPYAFVQLDGEHFERRAVTLGRVDGPWVEIGSGLKEGERVVTKGGFDIHLNAFMGTIESHRH